MFRTERESAASRQDERIMGWMGTGSGNVFGNGESIAQDIMDDTVNFFETIALNMGIIAGLRDRD
ncbi:MAG: hypothetical protein CVV64_11780 [Candidatus Wallbacteria bacterium HGW-Wallbacteria-1]|uniref:Uncharacterized protein n=1 Tax=Candidatus Wallbacteria bacterium HGW-Wallbacteria-1 TaxID=2013854 RepID=A0A2N1PNS4_9BACT|nr:MAG: hypothetical protein CVV64_11780 [Candidatus Wallbacteria bacterium HGW-Wallbacteria-1]